MPEQPKIEDWQKIHSAQFILEDLNNPEGMEKLAALTGLPMGVIVAAMRNIFDGYITD